MDERLRSLVLIHVQGLIQSLVVWASLPGSGSVRLQCMQAKIQDEVEDSIHRSKDFSLLLARRESTSTQAFEMTFRWGCFNIATFCMP